MLCSRKRKDYRCKSSKTDDLQTSTNKHAELNNLPVAVDSTPDGHNPGGHNPDGHNPDGHNTDGHNPDGHNTDGHNTEDNKGVMCCWCLRGKTKHLYTDR